MDIDTDQYNCGACGVGCSTLNAANSVSACKYGVCVTECNDGFADCNNSKLDGCETNTNSDPRNCGGCGLSAMRWLARPASLADRVVEPCSVDAGGGSAR